MVHLDTDDSGRPVEVLAGIPSIRDFRRSVEPGRPVLPQPLVHILRHHRGQAAAAEDVHHR